MTPRPVCCPMACQLWQVDLDAAPAPEALAALSPEEQARAARFVFAHDRRRFLAAHAALRQLLAPPAGRAAGELQFVIGEFGKPRLAHAPGLRFNLSHSGAMALIAISHLSEIGVDVELPRPVPDALELASHYFSPAELQTLLSLSGPARERAFLVGWTRKEAFLKALGLGISVDLRTIDVGLQSAERGVKYVSRECLRSVRIASVQMDDGVLAAVSMVAPETSEERASRPTRTACELQ